jgi:hypothetical protein
VRQLAEWVVSSAPVRRAGLRGGRMHHPLPEVPMSRWRAPFLLWLLVACTACPHAFGKGGTIDRAVFKDMLESTRLLMLQDCGPATLHEICLPEKLTECEHQCKALLDAQKDGGEGEAEGEEEW